MKINIPISVLLCLFAFSAFSQTLTLPPRNPNARNGSQAVDLIRYLNLSDREDSIYAEITSGNIPEFQRNLAEIQISKTIGSETYSVSYFVIPDYLAIGCDTNYFLCPMTPVLAQRICNYSECTLPTRKMVDEIYSAASLKLYPITQSPIPEMILVPYFEQHNASVWSQRSAQLSSFPLGTLVGGDKKDVVVSNGIYSAATDRVVIYGWHTSVGNPIQPLYNGHILEYADYSHGIRLVKDSAIVNGNYMSIKSILSDPALYSIFSDEGIISVPYYPIPAITTQKIECFSVRAINSTSAAIDFTEDPNATFYKVKTGTDGLTFPNEFIINSSGETITGLPEYSPWYMKISACNSEFESENSEVLGAFYFAGSENVLVINGFDRAQTGNTYDFIIEHGNAIQNAGYSFSSATNEAVELDLCLMDEYWAVDYILGEESSLDSALGVNEIIRVKNYLNSGGNLFISGSEIGWDLDHLGSLSDKDFYNNYLKASYIDDAPNGVASTYYYFTPDVSSFFVGLQEMHFDNGSNGTYNVDYPDVIEPTGGSQTCFFYSDVPSQKAGICFEGYFPSGTNPGKVVYLAFPFETIVGVTEKNEMMGAVLEYFSAILNTDITQIQDEIFLYPNPANNYIHINIDRNTEYRIENIVGKTVQQGTVSSEKIDISNLSTGYYTFIVVRQGQGKSARFIKE